LHYATRLGWRPNFDGFVLWDKSINTPGAAGMVLPPAWAQQFGADHIKRSGTMKAWQRQVAKPAAMSSRLVLLAAAAFSAPLIRFNFTSNLGFNFVGLAHQESEIAAAFVQSILGCNSNELSWEWWVAPDSLLKRARLFGDQLFLTGSLVAYPERMRTPRQYERLLALQSGEERRAKDNSSPGNHPPARWRGIFVTLLPFPSGVGGVVGHDEDRFAKAPCIDIPAASKFSPLLDLPNSFVTEADLMPKVRLIQRMAEAADRNRGVPIRRYIRYLVKHRDHLPSLISKLSCEFTGIVQKTGKICAPRSMLVRFGLLYAGGCLAIEAGVLPWKKRQVSTALCACLWAALKQGRAVRLTPTKIRRTLRKRLRSPAIVARKPGIRFGPDDHVGFYETVDGRRQYTIHAKAFRRWFGSSAGYAAVLAWLQQENLLVLGNKPAMPWPTTCEWAERTPRWPDGRVQKSIIFRSPPATAVGQGRSWQAIKKVEKTPPIVCIRENTLRR
jgi:Domain of unknown function (DUF927)